MANDHISTDVRLGQKKFAHFLDSVPSGQKSGVGGSISFLANCHKITGIAACGRMSFTCGHIRFTCGHMWSHVVHMWSHVVACGHMW